ncbi:MULTISPECIES: hypothetical protein [unclassified Tolypothrix]|uniref:hypothetical protein n=1 Tax=unclassified Tolypothrix TaxID=2649714 RepID=UPI0005EABE36|nr:MULTISPECIES: hypothetical protein [unclassified Tolypothrix]BAY90337.1 carbonic anhydrase [Microchaete diplosiphon NIES-3275]EKE98798.1 hypothetical protein FDUTEX481_03715 [Tolypothrix sp. PCC 7601]MBE9083387.1 hypothetical protein [Tolypothrix sp. LEGE 11397]UYD24517.1 hypothetical protein HGR01_24145 [Tolypothrix sp. PCC 7712]UYD33253.1 hypothetical protein HG267_30525 [Tolypothrix sp. PCC 7601]
MVSIYAWIYQIETGDVLVYNPQQHAYVLLPNHLPPSEIDETLISPPLISNGDIDFPKNEQRAVRLPKQLPSSEYEWFPMTELSPEQWERIYRGSKTN